MRTRTNRRAIIDSDDDQTPPTTSRKQKRLKKAISVHSVSDHHSSSDESNTTAKRKSKRPKGSTPQPASSSPLVNSSNSSFDIPENFFRSNVYETRFKTNIVHKQYVYEKSIDQIYYHDSPLKKLFESCGISSMVFPPSIAYPRLIQQFFTNLECSGDSYTSFVKGKSLSFTVESFGHVLNISSTGL